MAISGAPRASLQREFLLGALRSVRQGLEQLQPLGEVTDRFHIGRALAGSLPCLLPVGNGLLDEARLGVVMGQQLRLGLDGLGKLLLQHLGNLLVILLPFALEQRLIGGVLNQRMLEEIVRLRRQPALIDQLGLD